MTQVLSSFLEPELQITLDTTGSEQFLICLARYLRAIGARHILVTGIPMPARDLHNLVLYKEWAGAQGENDPLFHIKGSDPLLRRIAVLSDPIIWSTTSEDRGWLLQSDLLRLLNSDNGALLPTHIAGLHLHLFDRFQIAICLAGDGFSLSEIEFSQLCQMLVRKFCELDREARFFSARPGELSTRERKVLDLTAQGQTAMEIATALDISQRTIHAHLQNASDKLHAHNKTHTVTEAIRYGQIRL